MAALPLPAAILDDLISGSHKWGHPRWRPEAEGPPFSSSLLNGDRKTRPRSWMTSFPAPPSWIQDGDGGNDVWRTSRRPWRRPTDVCPIHESCRSLTLLFSEIKKIKSRVGACWSRRFFTTFDMCRLVDFRVVASGQLTQALFATLALERLTCYLLVR